MATIHHQYSCWTKSSQEMDWCSEMGGLEAFRPHGSVLWAFHSGKLRTWAEDPPTQERRHPQHFPPVPFILAKQAISSKKGFEEKPTTRFPRWGVTKERESWAPLISKWDCGKRPSLLQTWCRSSSSSLGTRNLEKQDFEEKVAHL